ncbi:mechanosensitive ion channel domain-containing protein [Ideonella sp.]|uniref:mechanosensitive ion channel domain-containing protein n=1 Tax=Ideonella sp. TaxID=1929293 RepID=UPI003BB76809
MSIKGSGWLKRSVLRSGLLLAWVLGAGLVHGVELPAGLLPWSSQPSAAPASAASAPTPAQLETRLQAAREAHRQLLAEAEGSRPWQLERQMASARRLSLLASRLDAAQTAEAERASAPSPAASAPRFEGNGPYKLLEVDAQRDRLDRMQSRREALRITLRGLEAEVEAAVEARNRADAEQRLRRDQAAAGGPADNESQAHAELASLEAEVAELELLQADTNRERALRQFNALAEPITALRSELDRVRGQVVLEAEVLATLNQGFEAEQAQLATERTQLTTLLARQEAANTVSSPTSTRELQSLHRSLAGLRELERLARSHATLWKSRQNLLEQRQQGSAVAIDEVAPALERGLTQIDTQRRATEQRIEQLRAELVEQTALVQALAPDAPNLAAEQKVLAALQRQTAINERLKAKLQDMATLLRRSREDLGLLDRPDTWQEWLAKAWKTTVDGAGQVWHYEVFSLTETTQIDGRDVTVDYGVTVGKSVGVLLMMGLGYWAAGWLSRVIVAQTTRHLHLTPQMARLTRRWVKSLLMLVVVLLVLKMARIPLTAFAFLGGALAIGIGFGAQNVIKNLISGVIVLFERKVHVGDIVTIGDVSGTVVEVDFRATTLRGFDGIETIVPNSNLLENQVSNWSGGGTQIRRELSVGVAYGADIREAARRVLECARQEPAALDEPAPEVLFADFGNDALLLKLQYWIRLGGPRNGPTVDSDLRFAISDALAAAGIEIAFPQRDVHLDLKGPLQVQLTPPAVNPGAV